MEEVYTHRFFQFIMVSAILFCNQAFSERQLDVAVALELVGSRDSSIISMDNDFVRLNPTSIVSQEDGVFLKTNNDERVQIPFLFSDRTGCYTIVNRNNIEAVYPVIIKCKSCQRNFMVSVFNRGMCPYCGTQN